MNSETQIRFVLSGGADIKRNCLGSALAFSYYVYWLTLSKILIEPKEARRFRFAAVVWVWHWNSSPSLSSMCRQNRVNVQPIEVNDGGGWVTFPSLSLSPETTERSENLRYVFRAPGAKERLAGRFWRPTYKKGSSGIHTHPVAAFNTHQHPDRSAAPAIMASKVLLLAAIVGTVVVVLSGAEAASTREKVKEAPFFDGQVLYDRVRKLLAHFVKHI